MKIRFEKKVVEFLRPSGTSRGVLHTKTSWLMYLSQENSSVVGIGECSVIPGLSPDYVSDEHYESRLSRLCDRINSQADALADVERLLHDLRAYPSLLFGLETAILDFKTGGKQLLFDTPFTRNEQAIPINGLIWMGDEVFMKEQIDAKLAAGFSCIKMKIGAIDFETEFAMLQAIRANYSEDEITLRVDANGAFSKEEAFEKLERLASLKLHSIEQPIKAGNWKAMAELCSVTPLPIALDEELIGIEDVAEKKQLLAAIQPQFIILKPSLHGGLMGCSEWIELAEKHAIDWWMTSALELNVGLNAIAQFAATYNLTLPQGLGTGSLYAENTPSRSEIISGEMIFKP